jgi:hypothetical protein
MKHKEEFRTSNTPSTEGVDSGYSYAGTGLALSLMSNFVQKTELSTIKESILGNIETLKDSIRDIKQSIEGRETRFWIVNGIILAAIIAIFLFALPYVYYHPIDVRNANLEKNYADKNIEIDKTLFELKQMLKN